MRIYRKLVVGNLNPSCIEDTDLFFKSKPSKYLLLSSLFTFVACIVIPYLPFAKDFELLPVPAGIFLSIFAIISAYIIFAEITKRFVMKRI